MSIGCFVCGSALSAGRFCPACGSEQPAAEDLVQQGDPFIGRTISDRYEVKELINVGGMGRVYTAQHSALDRKVAIKFIHPHLLTAEEIVTRFMVEAQTASRLNHPNVVSIFDFGRTPASAGGHLFLVMEFLSGPDLSTVLQTPGPPLSLRRIADILCQTLAALGEAHHLGITHRDVKPENIILEPKRSGGEQVKVIDFGIAKLGGGKKLTAVGQIIGTPYYMAPEQASAQEVGPSADLYSVGIILFEMLTRQLPFDGETPDSVLIQHLKAPRPDPRAVAPERGISDELAAVCRRAIDIDPAQRYPSAEALAKAILEAIPEATWSNRHASLFPPSAPPSRPAVPSSGMRSTRSLAATTPATTPTTGTVDITARALSDSPPAVTDAPVAIIEPITTAPETPPPRPEDNKPLFGRSEELSWARAAIAENALGMVIWGRTGSGRTRLLREIGALAEKQGARVISAPAAPPPRCEVSCSGLRAILRRLVGSADPLAAARGAAHLEIDGLQTIMNGDLPGGGMAASSVRRSTAAALAWAVRYASEAAKGQRVVLLLDDIDHLDGVSRAALADLVTRDGLPRVLLVATSTSALDGWFSERVRVRGIEGLSRPDAQKMLGDSKAPLPAESNEGDLTPLYLEQIVRFHREEPLHQAPPQRLTDLVEWRMRNLPAAQRRTLQVLALVGGGSFEALAEVLPRAEDLVDSIESLSKAGFISQRASGGGVALAHQVFGDVALAIAPRGAIAELHARVADVLATKPGKVELRAYHAIRGRPDFEAFLLLEESARRRTAHGDAEGAIHALQDGLRAARAGVLRGDVEATSGCIVFGHKLGAALVAAGRADEAVGVLSEMLDLTGPRDVERALVLEQLALIADLRERPGEADARRKDALAIAERAQDRALVERLKKPASRQSAGPRSSDLSRSDIQQLGGSTSSSPAPRSAKNGSKE